MMIMMMMSRRRRRGMGRRGMGRGRRRRRGMGRGMHMMMIFRRKKLSCNFQQALSLGWCRAKQADRLYSFCGSDGRLFMSYQDFGCFAVLSFLVAIALVKAFIERPRFAMVCLYVP